MSFRLSKAHFLNVVTKEKNCYVVFFYYENGVLLKSKKGRNVPIQNSEFFKNFTNIPSLYYAISGDFKTISYPSFSNIDIILLSFLCLIALVCIGSISW